MSVLAVAACSRRMAPPGPSTVPPSPSSTTSANPFESAPPPAGASPRPVAEAPAMVEARAAPVSGAARGSACAGVRLGTGLDLVVLGSGGGRSEGRAASSFLIAVGGVPRYLVDAGPGSFARLGETGLPADKLDTFLLTHLHVDHVGDVPGLVKSRDLRGSAPMRFRVFGPSGKGVYPSTSTFVDRLFGPRGAFAYLPKFRNALRFEPTDVPFDLALAPRVILDEDGVRVTAVSVDHRDVPTLAYRIERAGQSIVLSGDLASRQGKLVELARGATVLVYDAAVVDPPGSPPERYELHTPPQRIGEIAAAAGARTLLLAHLSTEVEQRRELVLASVRAQFRGDVRLADDCLHVALGDAAETRTTGL